MMPTKENEMNQVFHSNSGRLQFLLMLDDLYFSKYGTRLTRREWICEQLKQDGYRIIIGLDWLGNKYRLWTPKGDQISGHVCCYPQYAANSREEIQQNLEEWKAYQKSRNNQVCDYVTDGLDMEFLAGGETFDPFAAKQEVSKGAIEQTAEQKETMMSREKPLELEYKKLSELIEVLPSALDQWMNAKEKFAFVVDAVDWQRILAEEKRGNQHEILDSYQYLVYKLKKNNLFLQVITPISGWAKVYNNAVESAGEYVGLQRCDEKEANRREYLNEWAWKQNEVTYVPSFTVESVERMLWHQYLLHDPSISMDFSRFMETAEEIVHLVTYEGKVKADYSPLSKRIVNKMRRVDFSYPMRKVEEALFRNNEDWNDFKQYMNERPPRYSSWGEIPAERLEALEEYLLGRFVGQDMQIRMFCQAVKQCVEKCRMRIANGGSKECGAPMIVFLAGPTRTGKSEIVRQTIEFLFGSRERLFDRFNGTALQNKGSEAVILGAAPGLVGYRDSNPFRQFVERGLAGILLVDEIHKAHHDVKDLFMGPMEKATGHLTFNNGDAVYFPETMIVFTSNNGCQSEEEAKRIETYEDLLKRVQESYCDYNQSKPEHSTGFEPAWRSRVDQFICFNYLDEEAVKKLVIKELEQKKLVYPKLFWLGHANNGEDVIAYLTEIGKTVRREGAEQVKSAVERVLKQALDEAEKYKNPFVEQEIQLIVHNGMLKAQYL